MKDACAQNVETLDVTCRDKQVIVMNGATYGRMEKGRCVQTDIGTGCETNVLPLLDGWCSGRSSCQVAVPNRELNTANECSNEFANYLEVNFDCLQGMFDSEKYLKEIYYL